MTDWNDRTERGEIDDSGNPTTAAPAESGSGSAGGSSWERDAATRDWSQTGAQGGWTSGASSRMGSDEGSGRPAGSGGWDAVGGDERGGEGGSADLGSGGRWSQSGGTGGGTGGGQGGGPAATAQQFLGQLQSIIDNLATQSAPVVREIGAKAAELAAIAAERAGPLAQRAAEKTQEVGARVAERSRTFAEDMRRQQEGHSEGEEDDEPDTTAPQGPTV